MENKLDAVLTWEGLKVVGKSGDGLNSRSRRWEALICCFSYLIWESRNTMIYEKADGIVYRLFLQYADKDIIVDDG